MELGKRSNGDRPQESGAAEQTGANEAERIEARVDEETARNITDYAGKVVNDNSSTPIRVNDNDPDSAEIGRLASSDEKLFDNPGAPPRWSVERFPEGSTRGSEVESELRGDLATFGVPGKRVDGDPTIDTYVLREDEEGVKTFSVATEKFYPDPMFPKDQVYSEELPERKPLTPTEASTAMTRIKEAIGGA